MWTILVTGSSGLIGSEAITHFDRQGHRVIGVDNNMCRVFFGAQGDTTSNLERPKSATKNFIQAAIDICDHSALEELFRALRADGREKTELVLRRRSAQGRSPVTTASTV
jgi:CDP-paratose 2-epimerase